MRGDARPAAGRHAIKKARLAPGFLVTLGAKGLQRLHGVGLKALLALDDGEGHLLAFLQALEARALDRTEVDEHVLAVLAADEAEALGIVEPLDGTGFTVRHDFLLYGW